jgi:uncharacterized repeat protein (TIGR03843 family)
VPPLELTADRLAELLRSRELELVGRMRYASNATFLVRVVADEHEPQRGEPAHGADELVAVYKPGRGERPLWDFPSGTLYRRELAAYEVSQALGWEIVPVTVERDGPFGPGMVQAFVPHDPDQHYFTLRDDHPERFRAFATFDALVNNCDRKAGHCLLDQARGVIVGIDHGLTFHEEWKLRTVIWDDAGEPLGPIAQEDVARVLGEMAGGALRDRLLELLTPVEIDVAVERAGALLVDGLPEPDPSRHCVPWPLI